jgi:hypothetical protein
MGTTAPEDVLERYLAAHPGEERHYEELEEHAHDIGAMLEPPSDDDSVDDEEDNEEGRYG